MVHVSGGQGSGDAAQTAHACELAPEELATNVLESKAMTRENAYDKATRLLSEARVTLELVNRRRVHAVVRGSDRWHYVDWNAEGCHCSCEALRPTCSRAARRLPPAPKDIAP